MYIHPKTKCRCGHLAEDHGDLSSNPNISWLISCLICRYEECRTFKKEDNLDIIERIAKEKGLI